MPSLASPNASSLRTLDRNDQNFGRHAAADGDSALATRDQEPSTLALDDANLAPDVEPEIGQPLHKAAPGLNSVDTNAGILACHAERKGLCCIVVRRHGSLLR